MTFLLGMALGSFLTIGAAFIFASDKFIGDEDLDESIFDD